MRTRTILALLLLCQLFSESAFAQYNTTVNQQRYWYYRWRLTNSFMVVGDGPGMSLPANQRHGYYETPSGVMEEDCMKFGDGTIILGEYIGMLATEYYLLQQHNQNTIQTRKELYYALRAINRLDELAETCTGFSCGNNLNGFLVRSDVPETFLQDHPELASVTATSKLPVGHLSLEDCTVASHDQTISLLLGLRLVEQFVQGWDSYRGPLDQDAPQSFQDGETGIVDEAKAITRRLIDWMRNPHPHISGGFTIPWTLTVPCTGELADGGYGGNIETQWAYAFNIIAYEITGDAGYVLANPVNYPLWLAAVAGMDIDMSTNCPNTQSDNLTLKLMALADVNINTLDMDCHKPHYQVEWMSLLNAVLNGRTLPSNLWPQRFNDYLNTAPCWGPYSYRHGSYTNTVNDPVVGWYYNYPNNVPHFNWTSSNLLDAPERRWDNTTCYPCSNCDLTIFEGEYNGIDYMLMHNLFWVYKLQRNQPMGASYVDELNQYISLDLPYTSSSGNTIGDHGTPITIRTFQTITADNTIGQDGDVTYIGGQQVILKPGFHAQHTGFFLGKINPRDVCSDGGGYFRLPGSELITQVHAPVQEMLAAETKSAKLPANSKLVLTPNPNTGRFSLQYFSAEGGTTQFVISDMFGREMLRQTVQAQAGANSMDIDASMLSGGIYLARILGIEGCVKFVIE